MKVDKRYLNIEMREDDIKDLENLENIQEQEMQVKKDKTIRLSVFQKEADSIDEETIPVRYKNILEQIFSGTEKSAKEIAP